MGNDQLKLSGALRLGNFSSDPTPASSGLTYFNTSLNALRVYDGSSWVSLAAAANEFNDSVFRIYDNGDSTKKLAFEVSGISTSTVRTITMPDANVDLGNLTNSNISASAAIAYSKLNLSGSIVNADVNASAAIAYSKLNLSGSIVNADVNASAAIVYSKLSLSNSIVNADINSSAAIAYSKLNLSGSIVNADVSASAAIAYSKLNLSSSIVNADVASGAAIARSKLASGTSNRVVVNDGSGVMSDAAAITAARALISDANGIPTHSAVTSTELGYVAGVTSAIQTQLGNKIDSSEKGANNGVATLDAGGKVPVSQLPSSVMEYKGTWAASTNTPTLANGTGDAGDVYIASDAGTVNFGAGPITFAAGDWVIYNGSIWQKSESSNSVISVNGQTGVVVLDTDDISEGSNLYFTDERAQDAVGGIVTNSSKVSLTYNDGAPSIVADIVAGSLVNADVSASAAIAYSKLNLSGSIVNADVSASAAIAYSKLSLSNSIVNADVNASAAIAYSKLNLSGSIVNADVNASAAIAYSKLAALTTGRALQSNASTGFVEVSSVTNTELGYLSGVTSAIQTQLNAKVSGPASASDNAIARYDSTTGKLIQDSLADVSDTGGLRIQDTFSRGDGSYSNSVEEEFIYNQTLTASTTAVLSALTFNGQNFKACHIDYMVRNGNDRRTGTLYVVCDNASGVSPSNVSILDSSTETAEINLSWSAAVNGTNVEISYTTSTGTYRANLDVKRLPAN